MRAAGRAAGRAVWLWLLLRAVMALLFVLARQPALGEPSTKQAIVVIAVVGGLSWLDLRRRNEDLFFANLGVAPGRLDLLGLIPPILLEAALRVLQTLIP